MIRPIFNGSRKKSRSVSRPHMVRCLLLRLRNKGVSVSALERRWNLDGRTCAEAATAGNASGSTARSDRTSAGSADATTNDDRCGQSSTNSSYPNCPRLGNKDGRSEANDLALERNTPSATNWLELMDGGDDSPRGCRGSNRLPCIDLEREEHVRDEWLVLDLCGNGHCDPDGIVRRTVCESDFQTTVVGRRRPTKMLRGDVQ